MAHLLQVLSLLGLFAAVAILARSADAITCYEYELTTDDFPNCIQLDQNLVMYWRTRDKKTLEIAADADGQLAWLAIGISEMGMKGIDYNIFIKGTEGLAWNPYDFYSADGNTPVLDQEQNLDGTLTPVNDKNNHTLAGWTRPLDSCDAEDIPVLFNVERSITWAYSYRGPWDKEKVAFRSFTRGLVTGIKFYTDTNSTGSTATAPAATTTATFALSNLPVPSNSSSVMCINLPLPSDTTYDVISYQGFNTTPYVRRIMGYVCSPGVTPTNAVAEVPYPCAPPLWSQSLASPLPAGCETLNFVWAPGALAFRAPPQAGFRIGAGAATTMVLQIFYQNAVNATGASAVGKTDSSGLNLTYTSVLRNATMGVLTLGNVGMRIPPANDSFMVAPNICPASCTSKRVLSPVTLVSSFYMMGYLGSASKTRHIRNGSAIMPVGAINYWDVDRTTYQAAFPGSETLLANDTLISLCSYNTSSVNRTTTTYGLNRWQELCWNYLTFYPTSAMPELDFCVTDINNYTTCANRTTLARNANRTNEELLATGIKVRVGVLNISAYKSLECQLHDDANARPRRKPNTKAAVASIVLVPIVLITIGVILYTKYSKQEELEALLARAREQGLESALADDN